MALKPSNRINAPSVPLRTEARFLDLKVRLIAPLSLSLCKERHCYEERCLIFFLNKEVDAYGRQDGKRHPKHSFPGTIH